LLTTLLSLVVLVEGFVEAGVAAVVGLEDTELPQVQAVEEHPQKPL
jgi:hypothetical protein